MIKERQIINSAKNQKKWEKKNRKILKTWIEKKNEIRWNSSNPPSYKPTHFFTLFAHLCPPSPKKQASQKSNFQNL